MTAAIPTLIPQYQDLDIVKDILTEKTKCLAEISRDSLMWLDTCVSRETSAHLNLDFGITSAKKAVSLFSIPDSLRECWNVKDAIANVFSAVIEGQSFETVAGKVKELGLSILAAIEAFCRAVKMCALWDFCKVENLDVVEGVGSAADLVLAADGIVQSSMTLSEVYSETPAENVDRAQQAVQDLKTQQTWWALALNIAVFAIEALSLAALFLVVASPIFLALSTVIIITDIGLFVSGKQVKREEMYQREVQLNRVALNIA